MVSAEQLRQIDSFLERHAGTLHRTRKGRVWELWVRGRPVDVRVSDSMPGVELCAGCNSDEDYEILRQLAAGLAALLDGVASEPMT